MASGYPGDAVRQINRLFRDGTAAGMTDGQLIERFTTRRGGSAETAFEALVNRHGPMVHRVVKGVLRDPHDVEDAFQATFLVLVKKAHAIGERDLLGPWLYGVAHRVALKARGVAARRNRREGGVLDDPPGEHSEGPWFDIRPILHEELDKLPDKYKQPVILCHLQGLTHAEAAQELAWPVGTVSVRLARARKLLKDRLTRRGLTVTASVWTTGLAEASSAAVPQALIQSTTKAALQAMTGKLLVAGGLSASTITLTKRTLATMLMSRLKWLALPLALSLGAAGGVVVNQQILLRSADPKAKPELAQTEAPKPSEAEETGVPVPPAGPEGEAVEKPFKVEPPLFVRGGEVVLEPPPGYFDLPAPNKNDGTDPPIIKPGQVLTIEVLEALPGRPITGDRVVRPDGTISLGFYGDLRVTGLNRDQIKVKLLEHLRQFIIDRVLGLLWANEEGRLVAIPPVRSNRVFVDDSGNYTPDNQQRTLRSTVRGNLPPLKDQINSGRIDILEGKVHRVVKDLEELRGEIKSPKPVDPKDLPPGPNSKRFEETVRQKTLKGDLDTLEVELYKVLKELKDLKAEVTPPPTSTEPAAPAPNPADKPPG